MAAPHLLQTPFCAAWLPFLPAGLAFVAPALPTTPDNSFARRATLGQQLRFLAVRGLLQDDRLGLRYVRRQLLKRRDEVAAGKAGLSSADEEETPQVGGWLSGWVHQGWCPCIHTHLHLLV